MVGDKRQEKQEHVVLVAFHGPGEFEFLPMFTEVEEVEGGERVRNIVGPMSAGMGQLEASDEAKAAFEGVMLEAMARVTGEWNRYREFDVESRERTKPVEEVPVAGLRAAVVTVDGRTGEKSVEQGEGEAKAAGKGKKRSK